MTKWFNGIKFILRSVGSSASIARRLVRVVVYFKMVQINENLKPQNSRSLCRQVQRNHRHKYLPKSMQLDFLCFNRNQSYSLVHCRTNNPMTFTLVNEKERQIYFPPEDFFFCHFQPDETFNWKWDQNRYKKIVKITILFLWKKLCRNYVMITYISLIFRCSDYKSLKMWCM